MNIPANDAISLNARSHRRSTRRRSRSTTRSPPPRLPFFATSSPAQQHQHGAVGARKHPMTLRHRPAAVNGFTTNGSAHDLAELKSSTISLPAKRSVASVAKPKSKSNGHASPAPPPPIDWEVPRKLLHSSIGFLVVYLYETHVSSSSVAVVLSGACTFIASVDFVRLRNRRFAALYEKVLGFLMRESEKEKINGVIWYLLGCIFVLKSYPEDIATVSILILSWCDTSASFFGRMYGTQTSRLPQSLPLPLTSLRLPLPFAKRKSIAGFLAGAATGALIVFGFWRWLAPLGAQPSSLPKVILYDSSFASLARLACVAVVGGALAGFAEAIDIGSLDDNLTLPIVSGGLIWALFKFIECIF